MTKSTASHHLKTLRNAGITAEREEGDAQAHLAAQGELEERYPGLLDAVLHAAKAGAPVR